ncbi:pyocin knob domain-containing protein [Bacillus spizizenii]|nr:pyocin knob domain-containing protein [Bacillus spizizenii]MCY8126277.1 pyocin knob domain-containing protein [Bacillus spizizenii]MCY8168836.1 pyocin knob domain-containing protein [Bacillus spizizenii]MCY9292249.1 pyocin knob domain-containing protein [Bacillus spizizenii]MCY9427642.1 pyocin knob domain-containing protein [Bacillus spizizenii]
MSSSKFVGQLKQNNIQINNLKDSLSRAEKHMTDYEKELSNEINSFMERQNFELKSHTEDINNPHKVTKTQVGLDKVLNVEQASKIEFDLHASNIENPHNVTATQIGLSNVLNEKQATKIEFDDHVKNLSNPHSVTKEQIGLGNVTNVEQASKTEFTTHVNDTNKHVTTEERMKWNGAQLAKLTQDNGQAKYLIGADFNTITESGLYYMSGATTSLNAPLNNNGYLVVNNYSTYPLQEYVSYSSSDTTNSGRRKFMRNKVANTDTWTTWREIESVEGSQAKVDVHANNTDIHVTKTDKDKWNASQLVKLTTDTGLTFDTSSPNALQTSGFYGVNNSTDMPDTKYYKIVHLSSSESTATQIAIANGDGTVYTRIKTSNSWSAWTRLTSDGAAWQNITLKNGAKAGTRTPIYAKWGSLTLFRGHVVVPVGVIFGTIPTTLVPAGGAVINISVSGTTGYAKLVIYENGDLKINDVVASDSNAVTGYWLDVSISI